MANFIEKLWVDYPVPKTISIWKGDGTDLPLEDLNLLIELCLDELGSDIFITEYVEATGITTHLPEDTITVTSAQFSTNFPFQGNRIVKVTFDKSKKLAYLRYFPAVITYIRKLRMSDIDNLTGDRLAYLRSYILYKMAYKESIYLHSVNLSTDNATIDFNILDSFRDKMYDKFNSLKPEILIYSTAN